MQRATTITLCRAGAYPLTHDHKNIRHCFRCNIIVYVSDRSIELAAQLGVQNVFVCPPCAELSDTAQVFAERFVRA